MSLWYKPPKIFVKSPTKRVQQWAVFSRLWWLYDAKWQNPFYSAMKIQKYLLGSHKPIHHPLSDCGDHVVIINTKEIAMPAEEWRYRVYFHHTGYPGGASWTPAYELHEKDPTMVMYKAVYRAVGNNLLRPEVMPRLHLFHDDVISEEILKNVTAQIRQLRPVPKRLEEYSEEEQEQFPKLFDWPKEYVIQ